MEIIKPGNIWLVNCFNFNGFQYFLDLKWPSPLRQAVKNMQINKKHKFLIGTIIGTSALSTILWYLGYAPKLVIGLGSIIIIMTWALWNPPEKHKEISDRDRVQATSRALGGSPPPDLWTPDIPGKAKKQGK